ncbi:MAG: hypothetical protein ACXWNZ_17630 [Vulcanimicrobiaceae bacterium]
MTREVQAHSRTFFLKIDLADLQAPVDGVVSVPIRPRIAITGDYRLDVDFAAAVAPAVYPDVHGNLSVAATSPQTCELKLEGYYVVPFGELGATIDMTLLCGAVAASLQRFLHELAGEIAARALEGEKEYARSAMHCNA